MQRPLVVGGSQPPSMDFPMPGPTDSNGMAKIPLKYHKFVVESHLVLTLGCYIRDVVKSGLYTSRAKF